MRSKQSSTADATYVGFTSPARTASDNVGHARGDAGGTQRAPRTHASPRVLDQPAASRAAQSASADLRGEGLLHDARNLVSAIGLYCDLLSMPGVLKPEHRQYPEELRLLGTRSRVLIEHLLRSAVSQNLSHPSPSDADPCLVEATSPHGYPANLADRRIHSQTHFRTQESGVALRPVSLRGIVERCSGLLSRVAKDCAIEVIYGPAADVPVNISEESIERILTNLVRNASQALDSQDPTAADTDADSDRHPGLRTADASPRTHRRSSLSGSRAAIRISVGPLFDRIGEARSWPFQHVRLVVEDAGCGMEPKQLRALLSDQPAASRGTHGIGFRVVRDLVAASNGDLRAASTPGIGTRVQIEWPVAATPTLEKHGVLMQRKRELDGSLTSSNRTKQHRSIPPFPTEAAGIEENGGAY